MVTKFKFPDVGEGIEEGEIVKWLVKEGDKIKEDQPLVEVETAKAIVKIPSPTNGYIRKRMKKEGQKIKFGEVLVIIGKKGEGEKSLGIVGEIKEKLENKKRELVQKLKKEEVKKIRLMPGAKKLIKQYNLKEDNLHEIKPRLYGNEKIIGPKEIKKYLESHNLLNNKKNNIEQRNIINKKQLEQQKQEKEKNAYSTLHVLRKYDIYGYIEHIPLKGIRKTIAERMSLSKREIPHVTNVDVVDVTNLVEIKHKENKIIENEQGIHLTYLPFIIKAVILSLKKYKILNSTINFLDNSNSLDNAEIIIKKYYNIGIAVDTEYGLMVPVIKHAEQKNIIEIAKEIKKLAENCRNRNIDLADLQGGTFTITNIGSIGGIIGTPIINFPEVANLGLGKIRDEVVVINNKMQIRKMMYLSLSYDHRVVDGADAARFLNELKKYLEDPDLILIEG